MLSSLAGLDHVLPWDSRYRGPPRMHPDGMREKAASKAKEIEEINDAAALMPASNLGEKQSSYAMVWEKTEHPRSGLMGVAWLFAWLFGFWCGGFCGFGVNLTTCSFLL